MTDPVKEQLSACLDGELPEGELDLLLKRLDRDPGLRQSLGGYSLIGEAMRSQRPVMASAGFAARVSAAIAAEPGTDRKISRGALRMSPAAARWLRPVTGVAIAAGVAAVAVVSLQPGQLQPAQQIAVNQNAPASPALEASQAPSYTVPTNTASSPAFVPAARLTNYVVAHSEYSSPLGRRTVLSGVLSDDDAEQSEAGVSEQDPVVNVTGSAEPQP